MSEKTVEIPDHIIKEIIKVYEKFETLSKELNRQPSNDELAESLNWSTKRVAGIKNIAAEVMAELKYTGNVLDLFHNSLSPNTSSLLPITLSKSRYCKGLQCPKILWLDFHKIEEKDLSSINMAKFDKGTRVGELARGYFGEYELVPYSINKKTMLEETEKLLDRDLVAINWNICEASFASEDGFCRLDILRTVSDGSNVAAWEIVEVKSSASLKPHYLDDMAYQYHILTHATGLKLTKVSLMHINNQYERMGELDIKKLFTLVDCTKEVLEKQKELLANIKRIKEIAGAETEPDISMGKHCDNPDPCAYKQYCSGNKNHEPPVISNQPPIVDSEKIKDFLATLSYPLYYLDFETFAEAIPSFDRQRPYQKITFQYSLHIQKEKGSEPIHQEFLAEAGIDPRREIAERLCAEIPKDACVLAYYMSFEKKCIEELAALFPDLAPHLMAIHDNIKDLIVPFKNEAWHSPAQNGSKSLKAVLPAMFPNDSELDYNKLDLIHNGEEAMEAFASLPNLSPEEQQRTRTALLAYCRLDTLSMVRIVDKLREEVK